RIRAGGVSDRLRSERDHDVRREPAGHHLPEEPGRADRRGREGHEGLQPGRFLGSGSTGAAPVNTKRIIKAAARFAAPYRVTDGRRFRLKDIDPGDTGPLKSEDKPRAKEALQVGVEAMAELQDMLYAQDRWAVLLIFQAMDAAGKDGAIKHVMSGVDPQGGQVYSFKAPNANQHAHRFLWRTSVRVPERGRIGIFNRSYYEEVLVVRVHPEFLQTQKIPPELVDKHIWKDRYKDIRSFERYLTRNGVAICKFFLHVSRHEQ